MYKRKAQSYLVQPGHMFKRKAPSSSLKAAAQMMMSAQSSRYNRAQKAAKETGFVDLAATSYVVDTTGSITLIATVPQGASVNQRVGKKIVLKSLQFRGDIFGNATATSNLGAVLIVYDKRPTGALPVITDILNTANSVSLNNDANSGRFKILRRDEYSLVGAAAATGAADSSFQNATFFLNLKGLPCTFKAAGTGAIADIEEGALYLVTVGSAAAGGTAAALSGGFRTRFLDV